MNDAIGMTMALPIDLNGQSEFMAEEVENVGADGMLPAESQTGQATPSQRSPKQPFGERQASPEGAGAPDRVVRRDHEYNLT